MATPRFSEETCATPAGKTPRGVDDQSHERKVDGGACRQRRHPDNQEHEGTRCPQQGDAAEPSRQTGGLVVAVRARLEPISPKDEA